MTTKLNHAVSLQIKLCKMIDPAALRAAIDEIERIGDHDHGRGPIRGRACPGGDCNVWRARQVLAAMEQVKW